MVVVVRVAGGSGRRLSRSRFRRRDCESGKDGSMNDVEEDKSILAAMIVA